MKIQENRSLSARRKIKIDDAELARMLEANPVAEITAENVFAIEATIIDSEVTRNGTEYPADWQRSMRDKWIGTRLHYSPNDHLPNAPDHVGWIYSAEIEEADGITSTVARFAVPIVADTERLVERLRAGLNLAVSIAVETSAENVHETADGVRRLTGTATPIHVALVGDPSSRKAGIRATSESVVISEAATPETVQAVETAQMLIDDAKRIREPVITEAVKYARLNDASADEATIRDRIGKWTLAEIEMYRDSQRQAFKAAHPDSSKQLAYGGDSDVPSKPVEYKSLSEITEANRR